MNEDESQSLEAASDSSGELRDNAGESSSSVQTTETTVVYTEQLNSIYEAQQLSLITDFLFIGLFTVLLLVTLFNRYL